MKSLNKIQLIGHLGNDVELFSFDSDGHVAKFSMATSETYTNRAGDKVESTDWHNIVVYNKAAEIVSKYLNKGDKVYIEGMMKQRNWQDDSGQTRYGYEVKCSNFLFLSNRKEETRQDPESNESLSKQYLAQQKAEEESKLKSDDDDLPF